MANNTLKIILFSLLMLLTVVALGFAIGLHSFTIIEWWKPVAICGILAFIPTIFFSRHTKTLTSCIMDYLEYPVSFAISFSLLLAIFYASNYFLSDHTSGYDYQAPIVRKYSEVRSRSHKTGRRVYREEKYTVYIIEAEMKDGKIKKMEKPLSEYNRLKKGAHLNLFMEKGLFSIPVIKKQKS